MDEPVIIETMGTVASLTLSSPAPPGMRSRLGEALRVVEDRFSLYQKDSEASRVNRGELRRQDASSDYQQCYEVAMLWRARTAGAFTPMRPDGGVDLAGVVKAMAMEKAASLVASSGLTDWCLNVGGDILVDGVDRRRVADGVPWVAGIVDPADRSHLLTQFTVYAGHRALATSGVSERGEHIWSEPGSEPFAQVSVAAADIVTADVLATAILAGGRPVLDLACSRFGIAALAISRAGEVLATEHFRP